MFRIEQEKSARMLRLRNVGGGKCETWKQRTDIVFRKMTRLELVFKV
jgi:hypothetical protein